MELLTDSNKIILCQCQILMKSGVVMIPPGFPVPTPMEGNSMLGSQARDFHKDYS